MYIYTLCKRFTTLHIRVTALCIHTNEPASSRAHTLLTVCSTFNGTMLGRCNVMISHRCARV